MGAARIQHQGPIPSQAQLARRVNEETGAAPQWWSNGPGDTYDWHQHEYHKVLFCSKGSIVFHLRDGKIAEAWEHYEDTQTWDQFFS